MTTKELAATLGTCDGTCGSAPNKHRPPCSRAMLDGARLTVAEYDAMRGPAGHRYRVERVESPTGDVLELLTVRAGVERFLLGRFEIVDGVRAIRVAADLAVDDLTNELLCSGAIGHVCELCEVGYETRESLAAHVAAKECWGDCERCERAPATIAETNDIGVAVRVCVSCSTAKVTEADLDRARVELGEKVAARAAADVEAARSRLAVAEAKASVERQVAENAALGEPAPLVLTAVDAAAERRMVRTAVVLKNDETKKSAVVRWSENIDVLEENGDTGAWVVEAAESVEDDEAELLAHFGDDRGEAIRFALNYVETAVRS